MFPIPPGISLLQNDVYLKTSKMDLMRFASKPLNYRFLAARHRQRGHSCDESPPKGHFVQVQPHKCLFVLSAECTGHLYAYNTTVLRVEAFLDICHSDTVEERHHELEEMAVPIRRHQKAECLVVPGAAPGNVRRRQPVAPW